MAFDKKTWTDRESQYPTRRILTDTTSGTTQTVDVERAEGNVTEVGDKFDAETMNDLEDRIELAFNGVEATLNLEYAVEGEDNYPTIVVPASNTIFLYVNATLVKYNRPAIVFRRGNLTQKSQKNGNLYICVSRSGGSSEGTLNFPVKYQGSENYITYNAFLNIYTTNKLFLAYLLPSNLDPGENDYYWSLHDLVLDDAGGGGGTTVIANPAGEATVDLTKIQVGSVIYAIPEGGGSEKISYEFVTKDATGYSATVTVKKYINDVLDSSTDYLYSDIQGTPVNLDDLLTFVYGDGEYKWKYTLIESSADHTAGYSYSWDYDATVDVTEDFNIGEGGTEVEANPSGSATAELTKIKIGETIYSVADGLTSTQVDNLLALI